MQTYFPHFSTSFQYKIGGTGKSPVSFKVKISAEYKRSAFAVPGSVTEYLKDADGLELSVLLYVLAKGEFSLTEAAEHLGTDEHEFINAVNAWEKRGVLVSERTPSKKKDKTKSSQTRASVENEIPEVKKTKRTSQLPSYSSAETAAFLESNKRSAAIIDSCENIIGKIFTTAETNIVIGMLDHLCLSGDYILLLFAFAANSGKKSLRYIEKMALSFFDRGITEYSELEKALDDLAKSTDIAKTVRRLFGIGKRTLTEKEEKFIHNWSVKFGFGEDVITRAYEITVNNTGDASMDYANAVMENWYSANLTTLEQIDESIEKRKADKKSADSKAGGSSFDTDDFFEAALRRSYEG